MEEEATDPAEQARAVAAALGGGKGKRAARKSTDALADGLAELDMDNYDQEDEQAGESPGWKDRDKQLGKVQCNNLEVPHGDLWL